MKDKLEVGMYVRTIGGIIDKVIIDYEGHCNNPNCNCKHISCKYNYYDENKVIKASHNIIDLIEVGDFVDYEYPTGLGMLYCKNAEITEHLLNVFKNGENNHEYKITSIVTKEQFEKMQFSLEG